MQAFFHVSDHFSVSEREKIGAQKIKIFFFQDKFYSLKARVHFVTVLLYQATWRAAKLGIFTHFTLIHLTPM